MAETIDELTVEWEDDGVVKIKELEKQVLSKGAWTTIVYKYQDLDRKTDDYGPPKATIRRYRKVKGVYREQSKFNISSAKQARALVEILKEWFDEGA